VPGPRDGAARPVSAIPVPAWAASDAEPAPGSPHAIRRYPWSGSRESAAGDEPAATERRYPEERSVAVSDEAEEATIPGLLPDQAERIAAVRAKLAGVLPPGTVGWQVPGGMSGARTSRATAAPGPGYPHGGTSRPAGRPVDGWAGRSHTARDAAVLRRAPVDWDPHIDTDPERTSDLRRGQGMPVRGYVRAGTTPVSQAAVTVIDLAGRQADKDVSAPDGWYELAVPRSGTYTLIARARGHQPLASVVAVDGTPVQLDLALAGSAAILGTARLAGGTIAVPAVVSLMDSSGAVLGAVTAGADGTFRFAELIGGGYTVVGNAPGYRPVAVPVTVPSTGTAAVELALVGDAVVTGVARGGRDRLPLPDALVTLRDAGGRVAGRCRTGPDGSYRFTGMPPGEYTLVVSGYPTVSNALHLTAGSRHDHDIMLGHQQDDPAAGE
jgi:hypothetical protein